MKKRIAIGILTLCLLLVVSFWLPTDTFAAFGLEETAGEAGLTRYGNSVPGIIGNVLGTALSLVGVLFFALTIYGGIMWMTARGNEETAKKALSTILGAIIGLIIVLASYAITSFIFQSVEQQAGGPVTPDPESTPISFCGDPLAFCTIDADCPSGYPICSGGDCIGSTSCTNTSDCSTDEICISA